MIEKIALVSSVMLPLWNIPLIIRLFQRKSSADISLSWVLGVWVSIVGMTPYGLMSSDIVWRVYSVINIIMFSGVTFTVVYYRLKKRIHHEKS